LKHTALQKHKAVGSLEFFSNNQQTWDFVDFSFIISVGANIIKMIEASEVRWTGRLRNNAGERDKSIQSFSQET
jgi:hypothetical protein